MNALLRVGLRLAVSAAAFWLAFSLAAEVSVLDAAVPEPGWLALAAILHLAILAAITWRWRMLLNEISPGPPPTFVTLAAINWIGLGVGHVALGTLSGDAMRVLHLQRRGQSWGAVTRSVLFDRLMGLVGLALIVICALGAALGDAFAAIIAGAGVMAAVIGMTGLVLLRRRFGSARMGAVVETFLTDLRRLMASSAGWVGLLLTIAGHLINICIFYAMSRAFGLQPDPAATFVAVPGGIFSSALPISLGGWGIRELSVAVLFDLAGAPFRDAVLASILFGLSHVAMGMPGLILLLFKVRGIVGPIENQTGEGR